MEALETRCYNNMQNMIKTVEGLGIEYDEDVVCDVCKSVSYNICIVGSGVCPENPDRFITSKHVVIA